MRDLWIPIEEAAEHLGITERAVRMALHKYETRQVPAKGAPGGLRSEILVSSLPTTAQESWSRANLPEIPEVNVVVEDTESIRRAYDNAPTRIKNYFDKWSLILSRSAGVVGTAELGSWVRNWNRVNPDMATSAKSLYRVRTLVRSEGRDALLRTSTTWKSTVLDSWFDYFKDAYLTQDLRSAWLCRTIALGRAKDAGDDVDDNTFPSLHAFERRLKKELAPATIFHARYGQKPFEDRYGIHLERDYSNLPVGQCWVGDTRTWDVFVRVPGQDAPATCYITLFLDMRSYLPMGWHVHTSDPCTDNTLRAIRRGIETYGLPDDLYLDNGREYRNKDFSGQTRGHRICEDEQRAESLASRLGFRIHFAVVKNARAKIIERQFLVIKNSFDKLFPSYKGGSVAEKPEKLKANLKAGIYPDFAEFKDMVDTYLLDVFANMPCQGKHHEGKTRAQLWNALISEHPMRRVTPETARMLTTRTASGRIHHRGFRLVELDCWYWAEFMPVYKGREITLRYDPEDLRVAQAFASDGTLLGEAQLIQAVDALVSPEDVVGKTMVAEGQARKARERKLLKELLPETNRDESHELLSSLRSALGRTEINIPAGGLMVTSHDYDMATLTEDRKAGRNDLTGLIVDSEPKKPLFTWEDEVPYARHA